MKENTLLNDSQYQKEYTLRHMLPLFIALIINATGHAYFFITFPALAREFTIGDVQASLVLSLSALVLTFSAPIWGQVCESWGRRNVILIGTLGTGLSIATLAGMIQLTFMSILSLSWVFHVFLSIRLAHAAVSGGLMPSAQAVVTDVTGSELRVKGMGLLGASFGIGTILGGALATQTGIHLVVEGYVLISFVLVITSLVLLKYLPETANKPKESEQQSVAMPFKRITPYLLTTLLCIAIYSLLQQVTVLRLQDSFGLLSDESVKFTGGVMMAAMVAMTFAQIVIVGKLKWPPMRFIFLGSFLAFCAMFVATYAMSPQMLLLAMLLLGLGLGILLPGNLAMMSLSVSLYQQAKIAGINGFSKGVGMILGPVSGASLHRLSPQAPYILGIIAFAIIAIIFVMIRINKVALSQ